MKKAKSSKVFLIAAAAVLLLAFVIVGIAAGVGLWGSSGEGELLAEHELGGCSVLIYGHKPALFPEGFIRGKIVCSSGENKYVVDERTFSFGTDEDDKERFTFTDDEPTVHVIVHDEHGDIQYDIIPSEIFG